MMRKNAKMLNTRFRKTRIVPRLLLAMIDPPCHATNPSGPRPQVDRVYDLSKRRGLRKRRTASPETLRAGIMPGGYAPVKHNSSLARGHAGALQFIQSALERLLALQEQSRFHLPIIAQRP